MSSVDAESIYQLLPAVYRVRDAQQGSPLRALIEVLASQAGVVEADIARLYANMFIETCDEWVVPYLGDLLSVRGLLPTDRAGWSQRALVANTLQYRQRKGTVSLLEQLVRDVTGWAARAVELYNNVGMTQYLDHLRLALGGTGNLRDLHDISLVGSAFDPQSYTPDVRLMSGTRQAPQMEAERPVSPAGRRLVGVGQGRPNLPNIGLYIWRLKPYHLDRATAYPHGQGRFSFSPLGNDTPLCNEPPAGRDFSNAALEHELPAALRIEALAGELAARCQAIINQRRPPAYFFGERPAFEIFMPDSTITPEELIVCDLSNWAWQDTRPDDQKQRFLAKAAVDPTRGRILLAQDNIASELQVSYTYAFSDDIGGGPYVRRRLESVTVDPVGKPIPVHRSRPLELALIDWVHLAPPKAVIQIGDNATYPVSVQSRATPGWDIQLGDSKLEIRAADGWRPVLVGDLKVIGSAPTAELTLSGLLIAGQVQISGQLGRLTLIDCTLVPGTAAQQQPGSAVRPSLVAAGLLSLSQVTIARSIVGSICLPAQVGGLAISDSIVDAHEPAPAATVRDPSPAVPWIGLNQFSRPLSPRGTFVVRPITVAGQLPAISGSASGHIAGPSAEIERTTVIGSVYLSSLTLAEDVLFTSSVTSEHPETGLLRNCYAPPEALSTLRHEHCVPDDNRSVAEVLLPAFTARRYGEPGYAQLSLACPVEIRTGGTMGAEIGVFHNLHQPQREGALLAQLEEYLRFGLEAGLIYVD